MGYARSPFRDFEIYLTIPVGLDEDDIQLILKQCISYFFPYKIPPRLYMVKDILDNVYKMGDHDGTLNIEYDDITMKTKLIFFSFWWNCGTLRFDEKSF